MRKTVVVIFLALCLAAGTAGADSKFNFAAGTAIAGGGISFNFLHSIPSDALSFLSLRVSPRFGSFLTRDTMLFSFCDFQMDVDFNAPAWNGGLARNT